MEEDLKNKEEKMEDDLKKIKKIKMEDDLNFF
jgi:hypothetical protein